MPTEVLSYYLKNKDRKVRLGFQVILQCAPFLKGLKVSGLISMENESYSELEEMLNDKEYSLNVFGIERGNTKPRKDIAKWSDVKESIIYMYNNKFADTNVEYQFGKIDNKEEINKILISYIEKHFSISDDKQTWFDKMKDLAEEYGYAREVKEYKQNPENYKGHVGDISTVIRVALTGRQNTPDLYEIMQVLGENSIRERIEKVIGK